MLSHYRSLCQIEESFRITKHDLKVRPVYHWTPSRETVQKTSLGYAGGKPNPLNPPYQGDLPLNSPLIRGARGVKNDERWVSCTVSRVRAHIAPDFDGLSLLNRWQPNKYADFGRKVVCSALIFYL